jgi:adenine-specific DNA-methyltransferase
MIYKRPQNAYDHVSTASATIFQGDCMDLIKKIPDAQIALTISSPPYCMGKEYESSNEIADFTAAHAKLLPEIVRITKPGGSICWQVGYYVEDSAIVPLDYLVFNILKDTPFIKLRNRIVWTFGHGLHCTKRFSGRHEVILWFTKDDTHHFDLDAVRVAQKYPGKKSNKGPRKGEYSGNPLGKNPSDVWDIPNVKSHHVEKTDHPCQFPVALAERCVKAFTKPKDIVFDPFCGVASSGVAATMHGRRFLGAETNAEYVAIGEERLREQARGNLAIRPLDQDIYEPKLTEAVATRPAHFVNHVRVGKDMSELGKPGVKI